MSVVLPAQEPTLGGQLALLELERAGFEAELGAPVAFVGSDPGHGARWLLVLDPDHEAPPVTAWEPGATTIVSRAGDVDGLFEGLNLWRTARRTRRAAEATDCDSLAEAGDRIVAEVADTYPAFALRGLDWEEICARHRDLLVRAEDPLRAAQTWVAELQDSHTWVWPGHANLPYALEVGSRAVVFVHVPPFTSGHAAGVRPGWGLAGIDGREPDGTEWLARTAAPGHSLPYLAGRRLLSGPARVPRVLTATGPAGREATWEEEPSPRPAEPTVTWRRLPSGAGYLRIAAWLEGSGEEIEGALTELRGAQTLVLDLRRNPGGNLVLAAATRDRFLRTETTLGSIQYSVGEGELSTPVPLTAEPPEEPARWPGRLIALTDELTFSSSEDFLLGLQGLDHVTVVGRPSGGGSGRPRSIRLLPGWTLTVSTALTFDRNGRCIEGAGIPVDVHVPRTDGEVDAALHAAEAL